MEFIAVRWRETVFGFREACVQCADHCRRICLFRIDRSACVHNTRVSYCLVMGSTISRAIIDHAPSFIQTPRAWKPFAERIISRGDTCHGRNAKTHRRPHYTWYYGKSLSLYICTYPVALIVFFFFFWILIYLNGVCNEPLIL